MGGSSRASYDSSLNTTDATDNKGLVIGSRSNISNSSIQVTDGGAIAGAFDFGNNALASNLAAVHDATDLADDVVTQGFKQSNQALSNANTQVSQAIGTVGAQSSTVAAYMRDTAQQVGELAKSFQSQGQSDQQKIYLWGALAGITGIVLVAVILTRGKK